VAYCKGIQDAQPSLADRPVSNQAEPIGSVAEKEAVFQQLR